MPGPVLPTAGVLARASLFLLLAARGLTAQSIVAPTPLTLDSALARAARLSPALAAMRADAGAAAARERQARTFANPSLAWSYERTAGDGNRNSQHITTIEQPLAIGVRGARGDAAEARRAAADARLADAGAALTFTVVRAYATALAADERARLASGAEATFVRASRVSAERLAAGDVSGYAHRRILLEAARYAALRAEAALSRRSARRALLSLVASTASDAEAEALQLGSTGPDLVPSLLALPRDSAVALALAQRGDLIAARAEAQAAQADARLARWERIPAPTLIAGLKSEQAAGLGSLRGIAAGLAVPLPIFDRRTGAALAADATGARAVALRAEAERLARQEVLDALDASAAADAQVAALAPALGDEADRALAAAQAAYDEGEIALIEWLDAVRAHHEARASFATLRSDALIRRAALARALGIPLVR